MEAWINPTAPATCGEAIEVPDNDDVPPPVYVDNTCVPGAPKSIVVSP